MTKNIIKVSNLSKRYRLGLKEQQADTLVRQFKNILTAPYRNYKRLRELSMFGTEDESVFWALKDINFEVQQGEVLGIIGKNGAGKSTLLKILSQITEPTSGRIEIHGRVASLLEVGTGFHPELSGRENIYMNGTILGMTRREIDSKLDEIIDFSGVEKFIDTPVKFYSSGMKVRLGFSVAAHLDPEILIIDEVLAVGDYEFQQKCLGKMEDVSKNQGRTVLFVTHNLEAVKNLCPRSLLLEKGKVQYIGSSFDVIDQYYGDMFGSIDASKDLRFHPEKKWKDLGIQKIEIFADSKLSAEVFSNQSFTINLSYNVNEIHLITPMEVGFGLFDQQGRGLMAFNNKNFKKEVILRKTKGNISMTIPKFPIYKNEKLSVYLYFGYLGNEYEVIQNAATIKVRTIDYLGSGHALDINLNQIALTDVFYEVS
ncbi:ABC transporter ATP-binding protein [Algoriphagus algorifonticola]|uniref:ABC transporter ATP-binding protein n=1 Tax=Algoriphagus algorifonticola TaxID=2593007 RepID=UPI0011A8EFC7|nr:ABC transporter ATP-binding protein [Algoriphagus algorifonticola]